MIPFDRDPLVQSFILARFDYLQDRPLQIQAPDIETATNLGAVEARDFLAFALGYPIAPESSSPDRWPFFPTAVNAAISHYQLVKPVIPWPQPIVGFAWAGDSGTVTGVHTTPVKMHDVGSIQLWWGGEYGIIWEVDLHAQVQAHPEFPAIFAQFWRLAESALRDLGVKQVFTLNRDLAYNDAWYRDLLSEIGYRPVPGLASLSKAIAA